MFKIIDKTKNFKNNEFIYPAKQQECFEFINKVKDLCKYIIVFGSATTMGCTPKSDIDFAIMTKTDNENDMRKIYSAGNDCKNGCDIIWLNKVELSDMLRKNIYERGVKVYE